MWWQYKPYVSVEQRRRNALKEAKRLGKAGRKLSPIELAGSTIATTFWGKAWCKHLESYSDYSNRLMRGRSYVRGGAVIDLAIEPGMIKALVNGSSLYKIEIKIAKLHTATWDHIRANVAGGIGSVIELLQGRLSDAVMGVVTDRDKGMFPSPDQITMNCSCPDYAGLCKHLAAVLYGVGNRLDSNPSLLFTLRQVDHLELVPSAESLQAMTQAGDQARATIAKDQLADVFGVEVDVTPAAVELPVSAPTPPTKYKAASKTSTRRPRQPGATIKSGSSSSVHTGPSQAKTKPTPAPKPTSLAGRKARTIAKPNLKQLKKSKSGTGGAAGDTKATSGAETSPSQRAATPRSRKGK